MLLDNGAHVNAYNKNGLTALHWAAIHGYSDVVQVTPKLSTSVLTRPFRRFSWNMAAQMSMPLPTMAIHLFVTLRKKEASQLSR